MILLVANTKGGVGKSTVAINLAVERAIGDGDPRNPFPGRVLVIDGDRQETALMALSRRAEDGMEPDVRATALGEASAMKSQAPRLSVDYDDVVIDAGGRDNPTVRAAMTVADVLVMPFAPTVFDLWEVENMVGLVEDAQVYNPNLRVAALLTKVPAQGNDADLAAEQLAQYADVFTVLEPRIGQRVAFGRAAARGQSVREWGTDTKAVEEIESLVQAIYGGQS